MNLYIKEIKYSFKSLIIWIITISFIVFGMMNIYPTFSKQTASFDKLMQTFPEELLKAMGISTINFGDIMQFFGYIMSFIVIATSIYAVIIGAGMLSKEERDKTAEFLVTKPINRNKIVGYKMLSAITNILLLNIVFFVISYIVLSIFKVDDFSNEIFLLISIGHTLTMFVFMGIGMVLSVLNKKAKNTTGIATGIVFMTYAISLIAGIFDDKEYIEYITPFKYFDALGIVANDSISIEFLIVAFIIIIISIFTTFIKYNKRDINA